MKFVSVIQIWYLIFNVTDSLNYQLSCNTVSDFQSGMSLILWRALFYLSVAWIQYVRHTYFPCAMGYELS